MLTGMGGLGADRAPLACSINVERRLRFFSSVIIFVTIPFINSPRPTLSHTANIDMSNISWGPFKTRCRRSINLVIDSRLPSEKFQRRSERRPPSPLTQRPVRLLPPVLTSSTELQVTRDAQAGVVQ